MKFLPGTQVRYIGPPRRRRPESRTGGVVVGERDPRATFASSGQTASVRWEWIERDDTPVVASQEKVIIAASSSGGEVVN